MEHGSTPQLGPFNWVPSEIFGDARKFRAFEGPSRRVRLNQVTPDGGAFSYSKQHNRTVVVGRETLRFLTVADQWGNGKREENASDAKANGTTPSATAYGPGGSQASAGPNYWSSKLRATMRVTDVVWGPDQFSDRVFTSCSNGEIMCWNFANGGLKFDSALPGGARSVNVIKSATLAPHAIATGSVDGSVKLWDLRHPKSAAFSLSSHGSAVRSLTFGQAQIAPMHVTFGLESGMIMRYDLRMRIEYLDRVIAHTGCVHDLSWLPPSKDDTCAGYLASGSFDHTVKIWQIDIARLSTKPLHTLHTEYAVGKLGWRPGPQFATEVVVLPYHSGSAGSNQRITHANVRSAAEASAQDSMEKFAPQVWDVRKGWIAKWAIDAGDGPATDLSVHSSDAIHLLYKSGAFMQHDLREAARPLDLVPRHALSWTADDTLFFVADKPRKWDPPYDDLHPTVAPLLPDDGLLDKHPGDRLSTVTTQVIGMQHISVGPLVPPKQDQERDDHGVDKSRHRFMQLARGYRHHDTDRAQMCEKNQAVAAKAGDVDAAQTWGLLASLLSETAQSWRKQPHRHTTADTAQGQAAPNPNANPTTPGSISEKTKQKEPPSASRTRPKSPQLIKGEDAVHDGSNSKRKRSGGSAVLFGLATAHNSKRRDSSPSLLSAMRPPTRSPSSSPATQALKLPGTNLSMSYTPASMARPSYTRRMSLSSGGNSKNNSPGPITDEKKQGWGGSYAAVASIAFEEGSSSSDDEGDASPSDNAVNQSDASIESWTQEKRNVVSQGLGIQHPTLHSSSSSSHSSPAIGGKKPLPLPHLANNMAALSKLSSPQVHSQLLDIQDVNEDDGDESEGIDEDGTSRSSDSLHQHRSRSRSSSGSRGHDPQNVDVPSDTNATLSPPSPTLAKYMAKSTDSSRTATISKAGLRVMTRQASDGSSTIVNHSFVDHGIPGSYGSSTMTPTIGRMSIMGNWSRSKEDVSRIPISQGIPIEHRVGSMAIRTSPVGKSLPLRDMFSSVPNGQVTSTPTPTTAVSTQSGLRSALSNGSARFPKNQFGTITSSGPPPGSAGHEQDSFLFQVEKDGSDESKWMNEYNELVHDLEKEERKAMFDVIKDSLEAYAEEGNVQMCAALAMAAHEELEISPERSEQFVQAYLDQLMRMSLHLNAAYVRKISHVPSLPASTTVDAFFHTNCGSCGKLLAGVGPPEARGRHAFC
ncbi:hypothetical protein M408DRAFT_332845, partial [Serendipita vermifera MAFF 305830]